MWVGRATMFRSFGRKSSWQSVSSLRPYSADNAPKPFSEIPTPKGAVPLLGHSMRLMRPNSFSIEIKKMFNEVNGPIFRLKAPGIIFNLKTVEIEVETCCIFNYHFRLHDSCACQWPRGAREVYAAEGQNPTRSAVDNIQWFYEQRNEEPHMTFE